MKTYELILYVYKNCDMKSNPSIRYETIAADSPADAREKAQSTKYSSLADAVRVKHLIRLS